MATGDRGTVQFQVKGNNYFLHFDRDQGRWFVFEASLRGIHRTAVVNDDAEFGTLRYVIAPDEEHEPVVN